MALWERLGAFLFPPVCLGCQSAGEHYLCPACREVLRPARSLVAGSELVTMGSYEGVLQACLTAVKQQGHRSLARELSQLAADEVWRRWGKGPPAVVYGVRPSRAGHRYRGFSLPTLMQQAVVERTGWRGLDEQVARRFPEGQTSSQGMNLEERLSRQGESLGEAASTESGHLLILDDVVTTGATLVRAVETARALGFERIFCLALAVAAED